MDRKTFLRGIGLGAMMAATRVSGAVPRESPKPARLDIPRADTEAYWQAVRRLYPLQDDPLYLNTGGLGPTSQPVLDVVAEVTLRLQRHSETGHELHEPARAAMAQFLGASPDEICFTRNATEANSIIAAGVSLSAGDEVIFDSHAHPGGSFPWLNQAKQRGIVIKLFEPDDNDPATNVRRIRELITQRTKVIQVSHITCTTGAILPVVEIATLAREHGIWSHFDGAQSVGMIPVDLAKIACDSYAVSGHKWLGGPRETGALYIRKARLDDVAPTGIGGYSGEIDQLPGPLTYRAAAWRHEYGTRNAAAILGLAESLRLQNEIGRERIAARGKLLATTVAHECTGIAGLELLSARDERLRSSMVTIRHARADASTFFKYLRDRHRLRCRPVTEQQLEAVRISLHVFNSLADCSRIVAGLRGAAAEL